MPAVSASMGVLYIFSWNQLTCPMMEKIICFLSLEISSLNSKNHVRPIISQTAGWIWSGTLSYHHHVSSERVGQVSYRGVAVSIRRLALGAVGWLVASAKKSSGWQQEKTARTCEANSSTERENVWAPRESNLHLFNAWNLPIWNNRWWSKLTLDRCHFKLLFL